ncbi:hypothetical protein APS_2102 [Acetobacter pasteurianus subsp. pasteurianus LMG 1262 = NBRC 106471]|nr:hypothetical protein APS_2102 [Acetobacter pasteurianus subsp. pasteurianus LMG 1262 = NBRC 106471]
MRKFLIALDMYCMCAPCCYGFTLQVRVLVERGNNACHE